MLSPPVVHRVKKPLNMQFVVHHVGLNRHQKWLLPWFYCVLQITEVSCKQWTGVPSPMCCLQCFSSLFQHATSRHCPITFGLAQGHCSELPGGNWLSVNSRCVNVWNVTHCQANNERRKVMIIHNYLWLKVTKMASVVKTMRGVSLFLQPLRDLARPMLRFSEVSSPLSQAPLQMDFAYFLFWFLMLKTRFIYTQQELFHWSDLEPPKGSFSNFPHLLFI